MKASDLRIGNLLGVNQTVVGFKTGITIDGKVISIGKRGVRVESDSCVADVPIEYLVPIPLTEEWLLKFGFSWYPPYDSWLINTGESTQDFIIRKDFVVCDMDFKPEIKYVHQLQNLYFALTGEELELK